MYASALGNRSEAVHTRKSFSVYISKTKQTVKKKNKQLGLHSLELQSQEEVGVSASNYFSSLFLDGQHGFDKALLRLETFSAIFA